MRETIVEAITKRMRNPLVLTVGLAIAAGLVALGVIVGILRYKKTAGKRRKLVLFGMPNTGKTRTFVYIVSGEVVETVKSIEPSKILLPKTREHKAYTLYDIPSSSFGLETSLSATHPLVQQAFAHSVRPGEATFVYFVAPDADADTILKGLEHAINIVTQANGVLVVAATRSDMEHNILGILESIGQTCVVTVVGTTGQPDKFDCRSILSLVSV